MKTLRQRFGLVAILAAAYSALFIGIGYCWFAAAMACTHYSIRYDTDSIPAVCAVVDPKTLPSNLALVLGLFVLPLAILLLGLRTWCVVKRRTAVRLSR